MLLAKKRHIYIFLNRIKWGSKQLSKISKNKITIPFIYSFKPILKIQTHFYRLKTRPNISLDAFSHISRLLHCWIWHFFEWHHWFLPKDSLSSWNMSKTFLIGTGDIFDLFKGWETIFEDNCEDLSVCAMALSPSSKFMESSSNELVSIFIALVEGTFSKSL